MVVSRHGRAAAVSKMLSTEQKAIWAVKVPLQSESQTPSFQRVVFSTSTLCWNQLLSKATGRCVHQALQETTGVTTASGPFALKSRISTTDSAGANFLAERLLGQHRGEEWGHLHLGCNVHKAASALTKSLSFANQHVEGMVNFALSLRVGSAMVEYRQTLTAVVQHRPVATPSRPPSLLMQQLTRLEMMKLFLNTGTKIAERRCLLDSLFTGDWRKSDCIEVAVPWGVQVDESALRKNVLDAVLCILSHKNFGVYPRHR